MARRPNHGKNCVGRRTLPCIPLQHYYPRTHLIHHGQACSFLQYQKNCQTLPQRRETPMKETTIPNGEKSENVVR
jgi:hypothetical protein